VQGFEHTPRVTLSEGASIRRTSRIDNGLKRLGLKPMYHQKNKTFATRRSGNGEAIC